MDLIIKTCDNTLSPENLVVLSEVKECIDHLEEEFQEVQDALVAYAADPTPKNKVKLAEELGDCATMAGTCLVAVGRMKGSPPYMSEKTMEWVGTKNYLRGYHNSANNGAVDLYRQTGGYAR